MDLHRARNYQGTLRPWAPCVSATLVGLRESSQSSNVFPISSLDAVPTILPPCLPNSDPSELEVLFVVLIFPTIFYYLFLLLSEYIFLLPFQTSALLFLFSLLPRNVLVNVCFFLESEIIDE